MTETVGTMEHPTQDRSALPDLMVELARLKHLLASVRPMVENAHHITQALEARELVPLSDVNDLLLEYEVHPNDHEAMMAALRGGE